MLLLLQAKRDLHSAEHGEAGRELIRPDSFTEQDNTAIQAKWFQFCCPVLTTQYRVHHNITISSWEKLCVFMSSVYVRRRTAQRYGSF